MSTSDLHIHTHTLINMHTHADMQRERQRQRDGQEERDQILPSLESEPSERSQSWSSLSPLFLGLFVTVRPILTEMSP